MLLTRWNLRPDGSLSLRGASKVIVFVGDLQAPPVHVKVAHVCMAILSVLESLDYISFSTAAR